jgi:hypothetical protein
MELLNIYRHEPDGSLSWITSVGSVKMARAIIHSSAVNPSDEFLIYDTATREGVTLRADGHWLPAKNRIKRDSEVAPNLG